MHWLSKTIKVHITPFGIRANKDILVDALITPQELATSMNKICLPENSNIEIVVDDEWVRGLCLELPDGSISIKEKTAFAMHRIREIYGLEIDDLSISISYSKSNPSKEGGGDRACLAVFILPCVYKAINSWCQEKNIKIRRIGSNWGEAIRMVPQVEHGALVMLGAERMTVGAWSSGNWIGWRSFLVLNQSSAQLELIRWLNNFSWKNEPVTIWFNGWEPANNDKKFDFVCLADSGLPHRPSVFNFKIAKKGYSFLLRQKIIAAFFLAAVLASMFVFFSKKHVSGDEEVVSALIRQSVDKSLQEKNVPEEVSNENIASNEEADLEKEEPAWPDIIGILEQNGDRFILHSGKHGISILRHGKLIDNRFRVERILSASVVLTDVVTMSQREVLLK